jgi:3-deoxy-D-manno-octulosonic-acid transferase
MSAAAPGALKLYRRASRALPPLLRVLLRHRAARGKEDPSRLAEREGHGAVRPPGQRVIWAHAASVGETAALLPVLSRLATARPGTGGVLTTGTLTAAQMVASRLPPGFVHRYAPLDCAPWVVRFLDGWRPEVALRIDSELWPVTLHELSRRRVPVILLNGRLSARSAGRWAGMPRLARYLMACFVAIQAQDEESRARFATLGATAAQLLEAGALKAAAPAPDADPRALAALHAAIGHRPVWLAASTHPGEERIVCEAASALADALPGLLTIIAPRHPERGEAVAAEAAARGLAALCRSSGAGPGGAAVYVADTLGEMGLWYRLARVAFIGGSLTPVGGHNPYEPAALGVTLASGPETTNFREAYGPLIADEACHLVHNAEDLGAFLRWSLQPDGQRTPAAVAAAARATAQLAADDAVLDAAVALVAAHLRGT